MNELSIWYGKSLGLINPRKDRQSHNTISHRNQSVFKLRQDTRPQNVYSEIYADLTFL